MSDTTTRRPPSRLVVKPKKKTMSNDKQPTTFTQWIEWVCYFSMFFSGYLFFKSPDANTAQLIFRLSLFSAGSIGALVFWILRLTDKSDEA